MSVTLIQPTEAIEVKQLCVLIYGQPGARKSSLAQTAEEPITLAFDPGIYRAYGRKAAALFDTWAEVLSFDLAHYKTIVADTIGMALEKLGQAIVADSPKNGNRLGGLSLQGYGVLKSQFAAWVSSIRQRGQQLVFVAHEKAERNGDAVYYCPDIVGGSYNTLMNHCDLVGYMHFANGKRVIDFSPTDSWMAKAPPCGWKQIELGDFKDQPDFLAKLLAEAKSSMGRVSEQSAAVAALVADWSRKLHDELSLADLNALLPEFAKLDKAVKPQIWHLFLEYAKRQGLAFDKTAKVFVLAPKLPESEGAAA